MFSLPIHSNFTEIQYYYDTPLVILSIIVVILGTITALTSNIRIRENSFIGKNIWIIISTTALSVSIWSMHFIGMEAMIMPERAVYDYYLTALSCIPIFLGVLVAFYMLNHFRKNLLVHIVSSLSIALGVVFMHYIGMHAMYFETIVHIYNPYWFIASIVVSLIASYWGVYTFSNMSLYHVESKKRFIPAIILGGSYALMHYTGMKAIQYYRTTDPVYMNHSSTRTVLEGALLDTIIIWGAISVVILFLYVTYSDGYFEHRLNYFDSLTKLPNIRMFHKKVETDLKAYAVAIIQLDDLDDFKQRYGYLFVDQLIRHLSAIFKDYTSTLTSVYRVENHRFVFVALDKTASRDLERDVFIIAELLKQSFVFEGRHISLKGVSTLAIGEQVEYLKKLYFDALSVVNHPSLDHRFTVTYFDMNYHERNFDEEILEDFQDAMRNRDLYVVYQPKIDPASQSVHSAEALIRWQHKKYGFLSPSVFLPILETNDLMEILTDWIIEEVCQSLDEWKSIPIMPNQVAINIPGPYLTSVQLMKRLKDMTKKYGISPSSIELEITETHYVKTIASAERAVRNYRSAGFSVALDDFGTGVSSLSYLKKIPITTLKIDKSFVDGVPTSEKDASIIQSIIQLGNSLNLTVVVEGVESMEQVQFLKEHCDAPQMQGYYFAKPMRQEELVAWCHAFHVQMGV